MKTHAISSHRLLSLVIVFGFALALLCFGAVALNAQAPADASIQTAMSGGLSATGINPAVQAAIEAAVPPQYGVYVMALLALVAAWCRFSTARKNGLSPMAAIGTIFNGTNVKKLPLILAGLCMLSLISCGTTQQQKKTIAVRVGEDVLADVMSGATVYLTTFSGAAAGAAMIGTELKQLPATAAVVSGVLSAPSAKNPAASVQP